MSVLTETEQALLDGLMHEWSKEDRCAAAIQEYNEADEDAMEIRVLTPDEWALAEAIDGIKLPPTTIPIGAFDAEGQLVGRTTIMSILHIEGTWVDESKRGSSLAVRLVRAAERGLKELGATHAIAYTPNADPKISEYMSRFGYEPLPVALWAKPLNGEEE